MNASEIRSMDMEKIKSSLLEVREEYMNLRFQAVSGQLTDTSKLKQSRKLIAQYETVLREKELSKETEGEE